ncbi:RrF2 family transcriptional regulator [Clostridium sp. DL1XJH146]
MKISTKGRYGLIAMTRIAFNSKGGARVSIKQICEKEEISEKYMEQIISALKKGKLVNSIKGQGGGYILTRPPEEITVGDILRALEGSLHTTTKEEDQNGSVLSRCINDSVWNKFNQTIDKFVDSITLGNLVEDYYSSLNSGVMYYI